MTTQAIQRIFAEYCRHLDDGRLDEVAALFAEDGLLQLDAFGIRATGRDAIRAKYAQIIDPNIKGLHTTFNHIIDVHGEQAAAAADHMFINFAGSPRIFIAGRYRARFAAHGGDWKIKEWNIEVRANAAA